MNYNWIKFSVFYNKKSWNELLTSGLSSCLNMLNAFGIKDAIIYLSVNRGENVSISLLNKKSDDSLHAANCLNEFFTSYFHQNPSAPSRPVITPKFFKDFPNNSIQYGIHHCVINYYIDEVYDGWPFEFGLLLSRLIATVLAGDCIDDDRILTFATYFYLIIGAHYRELVKNESVNNSIIPVENYAQLRDEIAKMYIDVSSSARSDELLWINDVDYIIKKIREHSAQEEHATTFHQLLNVVNRQLGIDLEVRDMLFNLMLDTFKDRKTR